jgi:hypothetical protein
LGVHYELDAAPTYVPLPRFIETDKLHQHLSDIFASEQLEKSQWRILDTLFYGFLPRDLTVLNPTGHLSSELKH